MSASQSFQIFLDFDGTLARTFDPNPDGIGVHQVHEQVIENMFGPNGLAAYEHCGGLNGGGRSPEQVIAAMLDHNPTLSDQPIAELTREFVQQKLDVLMNLIGWYPDRRRWPEPYPGLLDFFNLVRQINRVGTVRSFLGGISSGHPAFSTRPFGHAWGQQLPPILVTNDEVLARCPTPGPECSKPGTLPFTLAIEQWRQETGNGSFEAADRNATVYIGDSPKHDGAFARNCNISFLCFDPDNKFEPGSNEGRFTEWSELTSIVTQRLLMAQLAQPLSARSVFPGLQVA